MLELLLRQGRKRFGEPRAQVLARLEAVVEIAELDRLAERLLEVETWDELLA
jgi:hypothetical protein